MRDAQTIYSSIEIPGSFLVPGFSIYVLEVIKEKHKWFYIGMTGDPYYPSARSAFHRISGHFELSKRSTQNQMQIALKEVVGVQNDEELAALKIIMYHFPIPGYRKMTEETLLPITIQKLKKSGEYEDYKRTQRLVSALEKALIFESGDKRLNKTKGKQTSIDEIPFPNIYKKILEIIK